MPVTYYMQYVVVIVWCGVQYGNYLGWITSDINQKAIEYVLIIIEN